MHTISSAREELSHGCDGPLTPFVLMSRATDLVARGKASADVAANALCEELESFGWVADPNAIDAASVTGS